MLSDVDDLKLRFAAPIRLDTTERKFAPADSLDISEGEFVGYASTWGGPPDPYGDIFQKGAFTTAIKSSRRPALLWSHRPEQPIGSWLGFKEDDHGLLAHGRLTMETRQGKEAHALMRDNALALSVGFSISKDGYRMDGSTRVITNVARLGEVSLVSMPANERAQVVAFKDLCASRKSFETHLRKAFGLSRREASAIAAFGYADPARKERDTHMEVVQLSRKLDSICTLLTERGFEL